jgi:diguanylate cyclase (GGDEF)-like protein
MLAIPLGLVLANATFDLLGRRGRVAAWHFWALLGLDTLALVAMVAVVGEAGYLGTLFVVAVVANHAIGQPRAARLQLLVASVLYAPARVASFAWLYDQPVPVGLILLETACLVGLGYMAIRGPQVFTYRVRGVRRAIAALERGDFSSRLSTRAHDDIGFLGASFNATVVAVHEMVQALTTQVAERERAEARLAHQAFHDALTGLANRVLFRDRVEHALARAGRQAERVTVLFVDLDGFKTVNDSLGHATGDRLLVAVAERLLNATRGCDTVARLGGDEFAVLLENVRDDGDAVRVAERVGSALAAPFAVDGAELVVGASVGIARAAAAEQEPDEPGARADALLRDADVAMYRAKAQGKGRYAIFEPHMHEVALERLAVEAELRLALQRGEFRLVYQPVVQLADRRLTGVEALLRWDSPRRGTIAPDVFIPVAEETGLIVPLGRWVLMEACRQGAVWLGAQRGGAAPLTMSVNVSSRQLQHASVVDDVRDALRASGLPASALVVEITESALVRDTSVVVQRLHELKALGVRLAIDDFGTGYSSLAYLQRLPVDVLKIDKSFVDGVGRGRQDTVLARTIIGLGTTLALSCVAEGIEHDQQHSQLQALGCELGQGFLFARPVPPEQIEALMREEAGAEAELAAG